MAKLSIVAGATSQTVEIFVQNSSSTTGAGLTGLVYNTSGLTAYYVTPRAAPTSITLATLASNTASWSSGGFYEIDSTHCPGLYRFDIPNAAIASGNGRSVVIYFQGASNMAPVPLEIELTGWDNQDATAGGISRLDAAVSSRMATFTLPTNFSSLDIDASGRVDLSKVLGTLVTATTAGILDVNTKNIANVAAAVDTNNFLKVDVEDWKGSTAPAMTGDAYARLGAPAGASTSADIAAVKSDLDGGVSVAKWNGSAVATPNVSGVPIVDLKYTLGTISPATAGSVRADSVTGSVGSVTGAVGSVTGAVGSVTSGVTVSTNNDKTGYALTAGEHTNIVSDTESGLTAQGFTTTRAGYLDVLNNTISELVQGVPPTNPTLAQAVMAVYMALRNTLTTTGSVKAIRNDAGTVIFKKALSDDGTTFTETKAVSGP